MGDKKDPGKFTIRFNVADPQQQAVVELLNRQGRYKAQFITSAVLFYTYAASDAQAVPLLGSAALQHIIADARPSHQEVSPIEGRGNTIEAATAPSVGTGDDLGSADMDAIYKTMEIFRGNKAGA